MAWFRTRGKLEASESTHQAVAAYFSDFGLLGTAARPHGISFLDPSIMAASLDHSMWFHEPTDLSEWHLYVTDSPKAMGARAFTRGSIYNQRGELVISTAQEGLIRSREK